MKLALHLSALLFLASPSFAQMEGEGGKAVRKAHPVEEYGEKVLDSLDRLYGMRKSFPERYRRSILIALSGYPELSDLPIRFRREDIRTSMAARPIIASLLGERREWRYQILIDTLAPGSEGKLFEELALEARIGILAHELAHILDYQERNIGGLILFGFRYAIPAERRKIEARTDRIAVERGFGWQLLAFKEQLNYCAELAPSYRRYKKKIYLSCGELIELLEKDPDHSLK